MSQAVCAHSYCAVWSGLVVVNSPLGDCMTRLLQRLRPVLVQAFVSEGAVKALYVGVLGRATRLDQDVLDTVLLFPCYETPASELRPVVSPDSLGVAAKNGGPIKQTGNVMPTNAKVGCDVYACLPFSNSSSRSRLASLASMPPYLERYL